MSEEKMVTEQQNTHVIKFTRGLVSCEYTYFVDTDQWMVEERCGFHGSLYPVAAEEVPIEVVKCVEILNQPWQERVK